MDEPMDPPRDQHQEAEEYLRRVVEENEREPAEELGRRQSEEATERMTDLGHHPDTWK